MTHAVNKMTVHIMLNTIVREAILPPMSLFGLLGIGLILKRWHPRTGHVLITASIVVLFFLCTGIGSRLLVRPLENLTHALSTTQGTGARAIVVLAAGRYARAPEYGDAEIPDYIALARLRYAAKLYRETGLPILVSGGNGTQDDRLKPKALSMAKALQGEFAVPVQWIEPASENTAENALFSARILKRENIDRILLVTDAMHMPRSTMVFAHYGIEAIAAPTIFFSSEQFTWLHLLPSAENLRRSYYAVYEWIGLAWYSLKIALSDNDSSDLKN